MWWLSKRKSGGGSRVGCAFLVSEGVAYIFDKAALVAQNRHGIVIACDKDGGARAGRVDPAIDRHRGAHARIDRIGIRFETGAE